MSREAIETSAGLSRGKVSKYERGLVTPSAVTLVRLGVSLGVSVDWLLRGR
jgi:transcriptional regulator with XRE-family HTH domain